jgi:hypothetical protein
MHDMVFIAVNNVHGLAGHFGETLLRASRCFFKQETLHSLLTSEI